MFTASTKLTVLFTRNKSHSLASTPLCSLAHSQRNYRPSSDRFLESPRSRSRRIIFHQENEIVLLIFSFLPFEYWILMSIVSKRFKYLWTYTPRLNFEMKKNSFAGYLTCPLCGAFHGQLLPLECYLYCIEGPRHTFFRFVDRAIRLHSGITIDGFHLSFNYYHHSWDISMINRWVSFTLTTNIRNLELNFDESRSFKYYQSRGLRVGRVSNIPLYSFPGQRFAPRMLTTMILHSCRLEANILGVFETLKYLLLVNVDIFDNKITKFLSKFPGLCDLCLKKCAFAEEFFVSGEVVTIEHLDIVNCMTTAWLVFPVDIIAPCLLSLTFAGVGLQELSIRNAKELKSVKIDINYPYVDRHQGNFLASLLNFLSHCQNLELASWCIQVLSIMQSGTWVYLLQLQSLRNLSLNVYIFKKEFPGIYFLLRSCPNLETLTMNIDMVNGPKNVIWVDFNPNVFNFDEIKYWELQDLSVKCLQNTLKTITIYGFTGRTTEVEMLKFLLRKAMVLENLYIHRPKTRQNNLERNEEWESKVTDVYNNRIKNDVQIAAGQIRVVIS